MYFETFYVLIEKIVYWLLMRNKLKFWISPKFTLMRISENPRNPAYGKVRTNILSKKTFFFFTEKPFLWQEIISYERKQFPLKGNNFFDKKSIPLTGNYFIWLEIISIDWKSFPLTGNHSLWQEIISFDRKSLLLTGNHFLWHEINSFYSKSFPLTGNHFIGQKISPFDRKSFLEQIIISK